MITRKELRSLFIYNPNDGKFIRKISRGNCKAGTIANCRNDKGYIQITINNKNYLAHRLIFIYMLGRLPKEQVDHKNRIRDDNRWCNLREASHGQNKANSISNNKTGFKGVCKHYSKYVARIKYNYKTKYLGSFLTPLEANQAYCKAAKKIHGEFYKG